MTNEHESRQNLKVQNSIIKKYKKTIWHRFIGSCKDYELIKANDKIAVCISGGKDSFLLAKCMQQLQKHSDVPFELEFLCMNPGYNTENMERTQKNAQDLGINMHVFNTDIFKTVDNMKKSACYMCARMRRGYLYKNAQKLGCNKIALGHHFNDVVETALMSMIWASELKTMPPKLKSQNYEGMELIRPLYLVRESDIIAWVNYNNLKFIQCACSVTSKAEFDNENAGARKTTKQLVNHICTLNKGADYNIFKSLHNVNLNMLLGHTKNGKVYTFNDTYEEL